MELVSILIPAYKPADFQACLTSALAQTWVNKEIIVSDDCPTDAIRDISSRFGDHVNYVRNPYPGRHGLNNISYLFDLAKGSYLKFLFDDDVLHPFCVQYLVNAMEAHPTATLAFSPRATIDEHNRVIERINIFDVSDTMLIPGRDVIGGMARTRINPIGELTTALFRKNDLIDANGASAFLKINGELCHGLGDVATFTSLCTKGDVVVVPDTLSYFRIHGASNSNPTVNGYWPYILLNWRLVIDLATTNGFLTEDEIFSSYLHFIVHIKEWREKFQAHHDVLQQSLQQIANAALELPIAAAQRERLRIEALDLPLPEPPPNTFSRVREFFLRRP